MSGNNPETRAGGPSRLFILRPVATSLFMLAILLAGIVGYRMLPVSSLPEVDYPTIRVVTLYPGASPDVMTSAVTAPLERQFGQMSGLKQMSSQSSGGASVITLMFQLSLPLDVAVQEVQASINAATNLLPNDLPYPPIYSSEPGGSAGTDPCRYFRCHADDAVTGYGGEPHRPKNLPGGRGRAGNTRGRPAPCRAGAVKCQCCRRLRAGQRNYPHRN